MFHGLKRKLRFFRGPDPGNDLYVFVMQSCNEVFQRNYFPVSAYGYNVVAGLKQEVNLPCIATNRLPIDGGKWEGPEKKRIQLLLDILPVVDAVDVELAAEADLREKLISAAHELGKTVIVSHHDFNGTTSMEKIKDMLEMAWQSGGDIAKFAAKANSPADTMNLLRVTHEATRPVCMIAMGDLGKHTRVIAPFYGSVLTYGSIGEAVAPGQLNIAELKRTMKVLL